MKKLFQIQKKLEPIIKDITNPYYKSKYFDINKIISVLKPILNEFGLLALQPLTHIEGKPSISTIIIDAESGEKLIESTIPIPYNDDAQKMGSVITYFRRYALTSLFCLEAEDDDGNLQSKNSKKENDDFVINESKKLQNNKEIEQKETNLKWLNKFDRETNNITQEWDMIKSKIENGEISEAEQINKMGYKMSNTVFKELFSK